MSESLSMNALKIHKKLSFQLICPLAVHGAKITPAEKDQKAKYTCQWSWEATALGYLKDPNVAFDATWLQTGPPYRPADAPSNGNARFLCEEG